MVKRTRKPKGDRGDDSDCRGSTLSNVLEKIYSAGSVESPADGESGTVETESEPGSPKTWASGVAGRKCL